MEPAAGARFREARPFGSGMQGGASAPRHSPWSGRGERQPAEATLIEPCRASPAWRPLRYYLPAHSAATPFGR
jgi:hypothetical protein